MAIRATYVGGVLRLTDPLDLPENTEVEILLLRPPSAPTHREQVLAALRAGGLLTEPPTRPTGRTPLSAAARAALQRTLPTGLNLSQAVIEGREEPY